MSKFNLYRTGRNTLVLKDYKKADDPTGDKLADKIYYGYGAGYLETIPELQEEGVIVVRVNSDRP